MDDIQRNLKVTIGGVEYAAAPFDEGQLAATQLIKTIPDDAKLKLISGLFKGSLGDDAHTDLVLRMSRAELSMKDWLDALRAIAQLTGDGKDAAKKATSAKPPRKRAVKTVNAVESADSDG